MSTDGYANVECAYGLKSTPRTFELGYKSPTNSRRQLTFHVHDNLADRELTFNRPDPSPSAHIKNILWIWANRRKVMCLA